MSKQEVIVEVVGDVADAIEQYALLAEEIAALTAKQSVLKKIVFDAHGDLGEKFVTANGVRSAFVAPTIRVGVDADRLAKELPEVFQQYAKETKVSASVRISMPKKAEKIQEA